MKKLSVFLILAIAAFAFVGCSDEGTALRWKNNSVDAADGTYDEIKWTKDGREHGSWTGIPNKGDFTDYVEVTSDFGTGDLLGDGATAMIVFDENDSSVAGVKFYSGNSAQLEKNVDATLVIESATVKK